MPNNLAVIPNPDLSQFQAVLSDLTGQLANRTKKTYNSDAKQFASWLEAENLNLHTVTRSDMIRYREMLDLNPCYEKTSANRLFIVARRLLAEAKLRGMIAVNPAEHIRLFKTGNQETTHTALTKEQARELLDTINQNRIIGLRDYALLLLLIKTGLRRFEAAALTLGDIRQEQGHHIAMIRHGKGDKRRLVKLPIDLKRAIDDYLKAVGNVGKPDDYPLFVQFRKGDHPNNKPLSGTAIERLVIDLGQKIGVPTLTPHGLRATFVTLALEAGATIHQVQYAAGHSDPRTTERYQKRKLNLDNNAVDFIKL